MKTGTWWKSNVMNFRDYDLSPAKGKSLWENCPLLAIEANPVVGFKFIEDFVNWRGAVVTGTTMTGWTVTAATAGTVAITAGAAGGILEIDSASSTAAQGANVQYDTALFKPAAGKHIWYECRFKVVDTFDKGQLFIGLAEIDTSIIAAGSISTANHIGFLGATGNAGTLVLAGNKATAATTVACSAIAEDTWIRMGFFVNGITSVHHYVNDAIASTTLATANIPIVGLAPSFVCQSDGTNDPILHVDYVRVVQLR